MSLLSHPAYSEEKAHLDETLDVVSREQALADEELANAQSELSHARAYDPDKLPVREMLYAKALSQVKTLRLSAQKPYFTRIDFHEDGGKSETFYIGKYGVTETKTLKSVVVDWRAPLANLYYSGQLGRVNYTAPDGKVEGELTLKRQFDISGGALNSIFDTDIVSQDQYLQSALNAMTGERLKEIVTTIQAEQNYVIRHPLKRSLIVAGAAGSGKTTIALHRIAYLLYAFSQHLKPENMLILAPNPLFLNYIAGVLPDLGVENVKQTTFIRLVSDWLESDFPRIDQTDRTERILNAPENELRALTAQAQFKGSMRFMALLDAFLDDYEKTFSPKNGISFGPIELYSKEEMDHFLLVDEKPFPMQRRVQEFKKQLTKRANAAARQLAAFYTRESDRRSALIRESEKDPEQLKAKLRRLYETRDERIKQSQDAVKPFIKETLLALPTLDPISLYRLFWEGILASSEGETERYAAESTLNSLLRKKPLTPEDVAPLAYIAMRVTERKKFDIRHIVIDEAQDFSPFEIALLNRMMPAATFTIVGDLMQGIHSWRALTDWRSLTDALFSGACSLHNLITSYRNTIEIMTSALTIAKRRPTPNQTEVRPVERHGEKPVFQAFKTQNEGVERINDIVRKWKADGLTTIAVIDRTEKDAKKLASLLAPDINAAYLNVNDSAYSGGVSVVPASSAKGLEFDGVIIANADEATYPDHDLDARLLYVCMTRPLHRLHVLYKNALTPLLSGV
ncbi:MAG: UvrD-helicase domain-containing protein [Clostridia bacterium]|nr:UvrD-helicase domain-containing protein [Clostridia bacterium]